MKKSIFLILTLAIPVSIFLFLKIFGNNEFEVPVLFLNGIPSCNELEEVHIVDFTDLSDERGSFLNTESSDRFLIFVPMDAYDKSTLRELILQLVRIQDAFYEIGSPKFILLTNQNDGISSLQSELSGGGLSDENYTFVHLHTGELLDFLRCELGLNTYDEKMGAQLVLVDTQRKIRGIYDGLVMEQTEQLILELKILRKNI